MTTNELQPIQIWTTSSGPNGWKPALVLEELGLPYKLQPMNFEQLIGPEFRALTPVGKVPLMYDPNTDVRIFESGAIILYIIENYDTQNKLTYTAVREKAQLNQWLMYQMSQQGPMYGQYGWFQKLHPERIPSCVDRYHKQVQTILGVLETTLSASSSGWLVGDKCTYADLAFVPWHEVLPLAALLPPGETPLSEYPRVLEWHKRMTSMPGVSKVLEVRAQMMKDEHLDEGGLPEGASVDEMVKKMDRSSNKQ